MCISIYLKYELLIERNDQIILAQVLLVGSLKFNINQCSSHVKDDRFCTRWIRLNLDLGVNINQCLKNIYFE